MKELKKLKTALESIHLSKKEKTSGRKDFLNFMEKNPMTRELPEHGFTHFFKRFYALTRRPLVATATVMGVFVVTASGISYAAESTVPGDLLYPVKVNVNEQVQGFFQFDSKSKAQWEIDRMNRRLEEVETLTNEGKLDVKIKNDFKQKLDVNTKAVVNHIKELKAEGKEEEAAEIESTFDTVFQIHNEAALDVEFDGTGLKDPKEKEEEKETDEPEETVETDIETDVETDVDTSTEVEVEVEEETEEEEKEEEEKTVDEPDSTIDVTPQIEIKTGITLPSDINLK